MITLFRHLLAGVCGIASLLSGVGVWIGYGTYHSPLAVFFYGAILLCTGCIAIDLEWPDGD